MLALFSGIFTQFAGAEQAKELKEPVLIIGASYAESKTPFNNGVAPLAGASVNLGSYLSLGQALSRNRKLPGYIINEGQAGATTFARNACPPTLNSCVAAGWDSYQTMLQHALARVATPPTYTQYNARYVVITTPNDCVHSGAVGVPQSQAVQCTYEDMQKVADRMISVGQYALNKGITPIFDVMPQYKDIDLPLFQRLGGQLWVISEPDYNQLRDLVSTRIKAELPSALVVDMWGGFKHLGDGIHPDTNTATKAAEVVVSTMRKHSKLSFD